MNRMSKVVAVVAMLVAAPALAHEKGGRAMGVIENITPDRIVVRTSDGHSATFSVTGETRFTQGDKSARPEDARVGQRAVVHGKRDGGTLQAVEVKLGASPRPR
jgi:hypothetical protein